MKADTRPAAPPAADSRPAFTVHEAFWGVVVLGTGGPPVMLQVAQGVVLAFGATFTAGALALMGTGGEGLDPMRAGLTLVLSSLALLLVWFATRGGVVELHLDLARGELRELVRHRAGRATLVGRHGLSPDASLHLDRSASPCALMLRLRNGGESLCIARGPEGALLALRRRLEGDLRGWDTAPARAARGSLAA